MRVCAKECLPISGLRKKSILTNAGKKLLELNVNKTYEAKM